MVRMLRCPSDRKKGHARKTNGYVRSKADDMPEEQTVKVSTKIPGLKEKAAPGNNAEGTGEETHAVVENALPGADQSEPAAQQSVET